VNLKRVVQLAVPGAMLMGGAWFASGVVALVLPGGQGLGEVGEARFYIIEGLHGVGEMGLLAALIGIHFYQRSDSGRMGSVGFWAAFAGTAFLAFATVVGITVVALSGDVNLLFGLLFAAGLLGWLIGFPLLGVATLRARTMNWWASGLLIAFFPLVITLFLVLDAYGVGGVVIGLVWLALAFELSMQAQAASGVDLGESSTPAAFGK
jgi:hypothetical protein